jgi:hypothetical protein
MEAAVSRPDGLYLAGQAKLDELVGDRLVEQFADGLVSRALESLKLDEQIRQWTLAEIVQSLDFAKLNPLLTVLLVLDAEINAVVEENQRVFPLAGFVSYRPHLPLTKTAVASVRLPPLNPDGHYHFKLFQPDHYLAVRLDIHPRLRVAGHIRIAIGTPTRLAQRVRATEDWLDRQVLTETLIEAALNDGDKELATPLSEVERATLSQVLNGLLTE